MSACRFALAAALALACASCLEPRPAPFYGPANFSRYVAIGNSLTAGYQSGGLVGVHQDEAYPVRIARQLGLGVFTHPRMSEPGVPSLFHLDFTQGTAGLVPFTIDTLPGRGALLNPGEAPYQDLGVPGAKVADFFYAGGTGDFGRILVGGGSQWTQLKAQHPTFVTFWLGSNDALDGVLFGSPDVMTPVDSLQRHLAAALDSVLSTGAKVIVADFPAVGDIPYATTVKPYFFDPITGDSLTLFGKYFHFLGQRDGLPPGPLAPGTLVTLTALDALLEGDGIPDNLGGTGIPLPDDVVITPLELQGIVDRVAQYNLVLRAVCAQRSIPVVAMSDLFRRIRSDGYPLGGVRHDARFLFGGIFSLDGVHPTGLGQAIVANEWIAGINRSFGASIPLVDLGEYAPGRLERLDLSGVHVRDGRDAMRVLRSWRVAAVRARLGR